MTGDANAFQKSMEMFTLSGSAAVDVLAAASIIMAYDKTLANR